MTDSAFVVKRILSPAPPRPGGKPRLGRLDLELTERCNNDCLHCCINLPADDARARARELTTAQVKDILQQAAALGCLEVRFTGGEPLLRPDWQDLYLAARRLGLKVLLFTNARLITAQVADLLARIPPRAPIEITVYGLHRDSYEAVTRAPGSFAQFWRGVKRLRERHVPFIVKAVVLPPNRHELDELEAWARDIPWMTGAPVYVLSLDLRNRRDDPRKNALIASLRLSPQNRLALLRREGVKYRRGLAEFAGKFMGPPGDVLFPCGAGHGVCIDAYGRAQPCMGLRAPELTVNLIPGAAAGRDGAEAATGTGRLADALVRFRQFRELRATNPEYLERCARCFLKGLCEQCPAKSWAEYGTLDTPVPYQCEAAHAQARDLGWLAAHEHGWEVRAWRERVRVKS